MIKEGGEGPLPFESLFAPVAEYIKRSPHARKQISLLMKEGRNRIRKTGFPEGQISFNYRWNQYGSPSSHSILPGAKLANGIEISRNVVIVRDVQIKLPDTVMGALIGSPLFRAVDPGPAFAYGDAPIIAIRNMSQSIRITIDVPPAVLSWEELQR